MKKRNTECIDEEVEFGVTERLVSTTDLRGIITYANETFCRVAGYELDELMNKNHNLVRHPDMPKAAFQDLWNHLKEATPWRGAVKNRCKDGRYYWVDAFVTPIYENGELTGYQSVRTKLPEKTKRTAERVYKKLNAGKKLESIWRSLSLRHFAYVVSSFALIALSFISPYFCIPLPMLAALFYHNELITTPNYLADLKNKSDSASRYVFSGSNNIGVADFCLKIYEGSIRTILGRIVDSTQQLGSGVNTLKEAAANAKLGVERETDELHQVSTAVEEMVATITEVASNTELTSNKVKEAHQDCEIATSAMEKTIKKVECVAVDVSQSAESASELATEAEKIGQVMNEIQGIADQTNLLALNAAIEAARAGEHGRGFSVVADEVRALSSRTHTATEQIQHSISGIQSTLFTLSNTMKQGKVEADDCVSEAKQAQSVVRTVFDAVTSISDLAIQISAASEEQSMVSQEISKNIIKISEASQENLSQSLAVEKQATLIDSQATSLASLGHAFKS